MSTSPAKPAVVVRFNDVRAAYEEQRDEINAAMAEVIERGDFINGRAVGEFEREFAAYCGSAHGVGASSGTSALHLALAAAGIGPGDKVVTTPMTFIATAEAVTHAGARPVFADIDPDTLNLDAAKAEAALTPRTRALIFVHLHGNPSGILEVRELAGKRGLVLIEDCAQAHGAKVTVPSPVDPAVSEPQHVGTFGTAGCFSFFPAKNLGAFGDAGALITDNDSLAARARQLANHGREEKYRHLVEGFNYRLDTLQAAILRVKLRHLEAQVERRNVLAKLYRDCLAGLPLRFQRQDPGTRHGVHLLVVETDERDALQAHLSARGIETGVHYPIPLHLQPAYESQGLREGALPCSEENARRSLSLPLFPQMETQQVELACDEIRRFFGRAGA